MTSATNVSSLLQGIRQGMLQGASSNRNCPRSEPWITQNPALESSRLLHGKGTPYISLKGLRDYVPVLTRGAL